MKATIRREKDGNLVMLYKNSDDLGSWLECFDGQQHVNCNRDYIMEKTKPVDPKSMEAIRFAYRFGQYYDEKVELTTLKGLTKSIDTAITARNIC